MEFMPDITNAKQPLVLIVDDVDENLMLMTDVLTNDNYRTLCAKNGKEGVEMALLHKPDIILMDIMMPLMDGFTATGILKSHAETYDIPVIFITALADTHSKIEGFKQGAVDYIPKPFQVTEVIARVNTHVKLARLQRELVEINQELEAANELKNKFFRIARHDIRNPIAILQLTLEFLKNQCPSRPALADFQHKLDLMYRASAQIEQIADNYLDNDHIFSLMEGVNLKPKEIISLVRQVVEDCQPYAEQKHILLDLNAEISALEVLLDKSRFQQALINIVGNAIKFSPHNTRIDVNVKCDQSRVNIYVRDQGPGILEEERSRLFQEFGKLSNKPTGGETSSGLGLWICHKIIEAQNGEVGADFPEGGGSIFWISLPVTSNVLQLK